MTSLALQVTAEQVNQAKRLMTSATLESVRMIHVRAAHRIPGCPVKDIEEKPMPTLNASLLDGNRFRVVFVHGFHGQRGPEGATEVQVDASFELVYSFPKEMLPAPGKHELQAFAETNAVMNCWPYWRELVQGMVAKMNLPPLLVPLVRWVQLPPKETAKAEAKPGAARKGENQTKTQKATV